MKLSYSFIQIFIFDDNDAYFTFFNSVVDEGSISFKRKITLDHAHNLLHMKKWAVTRQSDYTVYTMDK